MDVMITGIGGLVGPPPDTLFHNQGNGTFLDVTASAGIPVRFSGKGIAWGDYNNDGNIDMYIARGEAGKIPPDGSSKTSLYRNNGDGTFTEVTDQAGVGITANPGPRFGETTTTTVSSICSSPIVGTSPTTTPASFSTTTGTGPSPMWPRPKACNCRTTSRPTREPAGQIMTRMVSLMS